MRLPRLLPCLLLLGATARADVLRVPADFDTIQAAVDASDQGDTILIAAGSYDEQVVVQNGIGLTLRGQGVVELTGTDVQVGLDILDSVDVTVDKLRFVGLGSGLRAQGCLNLVVRRCRAEDIEESAFLVMTSIKVLLDRCLVDGTGDQGANVSGVLGTELRRCTFRNVGGGLAVGDCEVVEVDHLRVEHAAQFGLMATAPCDGLDVHDSRFVDLGTDGFIVGSDDGRFRHNQVSGALGVGFRLEASAERNVLDGERVDGSGSHAFELGGKANEAHACRAIGPGGRGFYLRDAGQHLLADCRVQSPVTFGVLIDSGCERCDLLDNRITKAGDDGIRTAGQQTLLADNVITDSGDNGFHLESAFNALIGNTGKGSDLFDLNDAGGGSTFLDNHFGTVAP